ncbi:ABC transporter ATP-binding protein [Sulfurivermis fontis]|uniref:ABC transporter ATP-binding protein n=1 Tax=Sulfurivermis fontis TaxID=1972068 RepID=UPI000FD79CE1|nr:ABC transporter ATP-binding protein [Sulfurivermis fontis]
MGSITVTNLGKAYKQYPTRWSRLLEWLDPRGKPRHHLHWVLKDINFTVQPGEAVGIIGINGAGKSTLLKIITGTTQPTTGSVHVMGRVAALLELGMGFHPDFTGRQNAYMAGQLLGYTVEEISALMPEIEAFAEIGDYIDQPVRVYSSGMQVRLAFSVATASRPEVLIIDEALSVGDAAFQRKCFRRIEGYQADGTTLLFVSHDIETVKKLCDRALFIKAGQVERFGIAREVCDEYEKFIFGGKRAADGTSLETQAVPQPITARYDPSLVASCEMVYGNDKADIEMAWLEDMEGNRINVIDSGTPFRWCYRVKFNENVANPIFAMMIKTREGIALYGTDTTTLVSDFFAANSGESYEVAFTLDNVLAPGTYYLNCGVRIETEEGVEFLSRRIDSAILRVTASPNQTVATGVMEMAAKLSLGCARVAGG